MKTNPIETMTAASVKTRVFITLLILCYIACVRCEENLSLTKSEKETFDQFKSRVVSKLSQDDDYNNIMKQDIFLIRWLRARNFNVQQAENMLLENLVWRKENSLDTILSEDWSDLIEELLPLDELTFDKSGSPIRAVDLEGWNVRRVILAGKGRRLTRYFMRFMEEPAQQVLQQQRLHGQANVTQWTLVLNLEEFNLVQHACPLCISAYAQGFLTLENHYPGFLKGLILINTPSSFQPLLDVIRPIFSASTRAALKTFGRDKKEWMDFLLKDISADQLGLRFGGTRTSKNNYL